MHSALFIDHIALPFTLTSQGPTASPVTDDFMSGGLSPWQLRRVLDFLSGASE